MISNKYFTGVGSRETPKELAPFISDIVSFLYTKNYILRSGGADGADSFFEAGVPEGKLKEIYLPWKEFNKNKSPLYHISDEAKKLASQFHPVWEDLSYGAKLLHSRNMYQVLGANLNEPSSFLICWTVGGRMKGGTAQAMRLAVNYKIPIFNLGTKKDYKFIESCMKTDQIFVKE